MDHDLADDMCQLLKRAGIWFRGYEAHHMAKKHLDGDVKARTNAERAEEIERMVERYERAKEPQLPFPPVSDGITVDFTFRGSFRG